MSSKEVSKEVQDVLEWVRIEIMAGNCIYPDSKSEYILLEIWNQANSRAASIIEKYKKGEGLFQK